MKWFCGLLLGFTLGCASKHGDALVGKWQQKVNKTGEINLECRPDGSFELDWLDTGGGNLYCSGTYSFDGSHDLQMRIAKETFTDLQGKSKDRPPDPTAHHWKVSLKGEELTRFTGKLKDVFHRVQ